ncbi:MAG: hypothetical protein ALECFALPRED_007186 [Alectoria fallacina]|uniref:Sec39 domain-containing protein n=1 Tax=Alectoria fallacina TaxID=1903189 RepID=A0A8H3G9P0_9LECA|nr:MAG: hypothetical protein ALECFALPRED_007186 [Alectoria fallacina]
MANPLIILAAVRHASNADIPALRQLLEWPNTLKLELTLRILLTFLPEGTEPGLYVEFLCELFDAQSKPEGGITPSFPELPEQDISENEARVRVRRLRLTPLLNPKARYDQDTDSLTLFLLHQAHKIDAETGSLDLVCRLLEPFFDHSEALRIWMVSNLLPLLRLDYEYYPQSGTSHSLEDFEGLEGSLAIQSLLSKAAQRNDQRDTREVGRDLRGLVGPWMYGETTRKRRKLSHRRRRQSLITAIHATEDEVPAEEQQLSSDWSHVNEWLLDLGLRDFPRVVDAMTQWDGPRDVDYGDWGAGNQPVDEEELQVQTRRYSQAGLAAVYATNDSSLEAIVGSHRILQQTAKLAGLDEPPDLKRSDAPIISGISREYFDSLSQAHLLHNTLLRSQNPLTSPTVSAVSLFNLVLASCYKLLNLGNIKNSRSVAELVLFGIEADQMAELRKTLYTLKAEKMDEKLWASIRRQMLWLRNWEHQSHGQEDPRGIFSKVAKVDLEVELLRAMLEGGCYSLAEDTYCKQTNLPLSKETVESTVLNAALSAYDAAWNGNRTRGGVRKASEISSTFCNYFPKSVPFAQTTALLSATHAMSFYSLTLQHGVLFQPVNIRAHKDPMALIGKILSQNPRSYAHLDNLLEIGQNLVTAGLTEDMHESLAASDFRGDSQQQALVARRRITRMAIEAALEEDDFDTAYSYVVNRLAADQPRPNPADLRRDSATLRDDISWRAAYAAGCYPTSNAGNSALRRLEQRMEFLSQALLLAPPSALSEVLTVWRKCEQQVIAQIAKETEEEQKWDDMGDRKLPGDFTADVSPTAQKARDPSRGALIEEAPIGLFDMARGAAATLSKNAFPSRRSQRSASYPTKSSHNRPLSSISTGSSDAGSVGAAGGPGRVRKRDMVSSMVTGGLASGIGWVIGESMWVWIESIVS